LTEDESRQPLTARNVPRTLVKIGGASYVLISKSDFDRLCERTDGPPEDAARVAPGSVGPDLRARRRKARLTLTQTARRAGIRLETLSRIENGHTDPSVRTVQCILRALEEAPGNERKP
jgi:DNA-binding XRE family transcriptional regulator